MEPRYAFPQAEPFLEVTVHFQQWNPRLLLVSAIAKECKCKRDSQFLSPAQTGTCKNVGDESKKRMGVDVACYYSSSPPVMVSTQELSVSEARVCSVDMDEMSLIEED